MVKMAIAFIILVVLGLIFFIKHSKWIGIALLLFVVEIFTVFIYFANDIAEARREMRSSSNFSMQIDDISYEAGTNDEGVEGYYFTLWVSNNAGYVQTEEIACYTEKNTRVNMETVSIYQTIGEDNEWHYQIIENREVPPGTQVTLMYFITQETLESVKGDKLVFRDVFSEVPITVSMYELK